MLSIAICDDNKSIAEYTKSIIIEKFWNVFQDKIYVFYSGTELLQNYKNNSFDIIVIDIEMPGINGIETAKKLRKSDRNVVIIFLTNYNEFAIDGYEANAFRYILKSAPAPAFLRQLKAAINECQSKQKMIKISNRNETISVKISEIVYAEVFNRIVSIHTVNGDYSYYAQLIKLEEELAEFHFIRTHKSYLVNLEYVKSVGNDFVLLSTGIKINLSKHYKTAVESAFVDYIVDG